ncbi:hypothetical protein [Streptomyces flavidovirens]|nr:hypothetical protein [Streptomyces flavidovirens]
MEVNLIGSAVTVRAFLPALLLTRGYYLQVTASGIAVSRPADS